MYLWRHSARFEPALGTATAWITTFEYRGAVERRLTLRGREVITLA